MDPRQARTRPSEPSPAPSPDDGKTGLDKVAHLPEKIKIEMPLDIVMSSLRPDELEKLQRYVAAYLDTHRV